MKEERGRDPWRDRGYWTCTCLCYCAGGYFANSLAIMTDAAHMSSDFAGFLISLFAIWVSQRRPSSGMSFGWHRAGEAGVGPHLLSFPPLFLLLMAAPLIINGSPPPPPPPPPPLLHTQGLPPFLQNFCIQDCQEGRKWEKVGWRGGGEDVLAKMVGKAAPV